MSSDKNRLIELLKQKSCAYMPCDRECGECHNVEMYDDSIESLADHLLANGIIAPPCKVGDMVYVVSQGQGICMRWNVYEGKVVDIHLNRHNKLTIRVENGEKFFGYYEPCLIFLTKEEAEEKLRELNKNA